MSTNQIYSVFCIAANSTYYGSIHCDDWAKSKKKCNDKFNKTEEKLNACSIFIFFFSAVGSRCVGMIKLLKVFNAGTLHFISISAKDYRVEFYQWIWKHWLKVLFIIVVIVNLNSIIYIVAIATYNAVVFLLLFLSWSQTISSRLFLALCHMWLNLTDFSIYRLFILLFTYAGTHTPHNF